MGGIFTDNSLTIGHTPLVELHRVSGGCKAKILAKIEGRNPAYSVKCRIGAAMIWQAEKDGLLGAGKELIEPTSGNTGIALAFVAASREFPHIDDARNHEPGKTKVAHGLWSPSCAHGRTTWDGRCNPRRSRDG